MNAAKTEVKEKLDTKKNELNLNIINLTKQNVAKFR